MLNSLAVVLEPTLEKMYTFYSAMGLDDSLVHIYSIISNTVQSA